MAPTDCTGAAHKPGVREHRTLCHAWQGRRSRSSHVRMSSTRCNRCGYHADRHRIAPVRCDEVRVQVRKVMVLEKKWHVPADTTHAVTVWRHLLLKKGNEVSTGMTHHHHQQNASQALVLRVDRDCAEAEGPKVEKNPGPLRRVELHSDIFCRVFHASHCPRRVQLAMKYL